ncbi:MAG: folate-binding protein [Hyphomicrobiaceae bacterium]
MNTAKIALLPDRGVVAVTGEDARKFLDNIITNDMDLLDKQDAIFAGLLSPQGKILFDFFVVKASDGFWLDVAKDQAAALVKRLSMYKLRAKVAISAVPDVHIEVRWPHPAAGYADPRMAELGNRGFADLHSSPDAAAYAAYHAHRIALGVPEGGKDYAFGDAFAHEALFDQTNGVSFTKGCYVGQEIVARMEHRGTARKRFVRVSGVGALPTAGTEVLAGEVVIGAMGSSAGSTGLALLRLDRVVEFEAKGVGLTCGGVSVAPNMDDVARLAPKISG